MKKTIAIVDDHVLIAQALKGIITNFDGFEVVYECENGQQLVEKLKNPKHKIDIVLLDISMPIMDGFETCAWLQKQHPDIVVIALSMQNDDQSVIRMIQNGAKGYLLKNTSPVELGKALQQVLEVGYYYPDWASKIIFKSLRGNPEENTIKLTDREKEFLKLSVTEMSYKEIADIMCCSPRTVESYRDNLFEKLELKTRVGLAVFALKNGYAD